MDTPTIPKLYTIEEAAQLSRRTEKALRQLRIKGRGPNFRNIDGRLLVSETDLADWLNATAPKNNASKSSWTDPGTSARNEAGRFMAAIIDDDQAEWNRLVMQPDVPLSEVLRAQCVMVRDVLFNMLGDVTPQGSPDE